jgi:hypothetical protein
MAGAAVTLGAPGAEPTEMAAATSTICRTGVRGQMDDTHLIIICLPMPFSFQFLG